MELRSLKDKLATAQESSNESSHGGAELEEVKSKVSFTTQSFLVSLFLSAGRSLKKQGSSYY